MGTTRRRSTGTRRRWRAAERYRAGPSLHSAHRRPLCLHRQHVPLAHARGHARLGPARPGASTPTCTRPARWATAARRRPRSASEAADRGLDLSGAPSQPTVDPDARRRRRPGAGRWPASTCARSSVLVPERLPAHLHAEGAGPARPSVGPRSPDETLDEWLARVGTGPHRRHLPAAPTPTTTSPTPSAGPARGYERTAVELEQLAVALAALLDPPPLESSSLDFGSARPS